tara:strand:+ start:83 stop:397 length:315 start_codon:yes stop_codon:yes gene_type:complete
MTKIRIKKLNETDIPSLRGGIYFFVNRLGIVKYIGMSNFDVYSRVLQQKKLYNHLTSKCKVKILFVKDYKKIRWYERRWLQKYKPSWNKLIPSRKTNYLHNPYQ